MMTRKEKKEDRQRRLMEIENNKIKQMHIAGMSYVEDTIDLLIKENEIVKNTNAKASIVDYIDDYFLYINDIVNKISREEKLTEEERELFYDGYLPLIKYSTRILEDNDKIREEIDGIKIRLINNLIKYSDLHEEMYAFDGLTPLELQYTYFKK